MANLKLISRGRGRGTAGHAGGPAGRRQRVAGLPRPPARQRLRDSRRAGRGLRSDARARPRCHRAVARHRGVPGSAHTDADGVLRVEVDERPDVVPPPAHTQTSSGVSRGRQEILELRGDDGRIGAFVRSITDPGRTRGHRRLLARSHLPQKLQLLETLDVVERFTVALRLQRERLAELQVRKRIREDVRSGAEKQQREYLLRRQMDVDSQGAG